MVIHLLIPVNTAIVAVLLPALVALAGTMDVNPAMPPSRWASACRRHSCCRLMRSRLVTYPAGYYRMYDMFKPGALLSVLGGRMTAAILIIAGPPRAHVGHSPKADGRRRRFHGSIPPS